MEAWEAWIGRASTSTVWLDPAQANRMAATLDQDPSWAGGDALPPTGAAFTARWAPDSTALWATGHTGALAMEAECH